MCFLSLCFPALCGSDPSLVCSGGFLLPLHLSKVLLPAQAPPSSPSWVSMACALVLPALSGLLATASASGLSFPSPEFFPLLIELVGELLSHLVIGVK